MAIFVRSEEFLDKDVYADTDEKIGKIKEMEVDASNWKISHLEIELTNDIANSCWRKERWCTEYVGCFSLGQRGWALD